LSQGVAGRPAAPFAYAAGFLAPALNNSMKTITIPNPATRDQRDAFVQQAIARIQRALRKMERVQLQQARNISDKG
jgi:hypothetical protein